MRRPCLILLLLFVCVACSLWPSVGRAQTAPELYGVREIVVDYARFDDPKRADTCGLSRDSITDYLVRELQKGGVPAVAASQAPPPVLGVARIQMIPDVLVYADESLNCVSWIALSAESRANIVVPPVTLPRSVTIRYWQDRGRASSASSIHKQALEAALQKMATAFAQQYKLDQPPEVPK